MANSNASKDQKTPDWYKESRGKDPSSAPAGAIVFTLLRLLELPWQFYFFNSGIGVFLITSLGGRIKALGPGSPLLLGLQHPYQNLILGLAAGTSASQIFWVLVIRENKFPPFGASAVAMYNTVLNTVNAGLALWSVTSQAPPRDLHSPLGFSWPLPVLVGVPLYLLGTFVERYSEVQRKAFKARPENHGKPFAGGFFGVVRNANYAGYTMMRTGFALVCGGWVWGALMGVVIFSDFAFRAVPWLEAYTAEKYGRQWTEVKRKVPYSLIPYIY